jgi:hypothetical protein
MNIYLEFTGDVLSAVGGEFKNLLSEIISSLTDLRRSIRLNWGRLQMKRGWIKEHKENIKKGLIKNYNSTIFLKRGYFRGDGEGILNSAMEEVSRNKAWRNMFRARKRIEEYAGKNRFRKLADLNDSGVPSLSRLTANFNGRMMGDKYL